MCDFYCGFECYGNMYYQFGSMVYVEMEELQSVVMDIIVGNFDNMCWEEVIKVHLEEYGIEYKQDDECCCDDNYSQQQDVFQNWLNNVDGLEGILEEISGEVKGMALEVGYCEDEQYLGTAFSIESEHGFLQVEAYHINPGNDAIEKRITAETNYEIYLTLLKRLFGLEPFKDFRNIMSYERYMEILQGELNGHLEEFEGKGMCTDEEHFQIESCIRMSKELNMNVNVLSKGCEACPNKACHLHP